MLTKVSYSVCLWNSFTMKDMREADVIPGIKTVRDTESTTFSQSHYIDLH